MGSSIRLALASLSLALAAAPGAAAHSLPLSCSTLGAEVTVAGPDALGQILQIDDPVRIDFLTLPIRDLGAGSVRISISPLDWNGQPRDRTTLAESTASLDPVLPGATVLLSLDLAPGAYAVIAEPYGVGGIAWPRCGSLGALYRSDVLSWLPALDTGLAFDTQTTPLDVSPERAELDLAYDVAADRIMAREVSGGTVETDDDDLVGTVVEHEVRVRLTTTELVDDLPVQLGLRLEDSATTARPCGPSRTATGSSGRATRTAPWRVFEPSPRTGPSATRRAGSRLGAGRPSR